MCLALSCVWANAASGDSRAEFFELHIRPLLVENCADCHSGKPKAKSRLFVLSREALLRGGDYGPAILPGNSEGSLLMDAVKRIHKELRMPPKVSARLPQDQIAHLAKWIDDGAYWPTNGASMVAKETNTAHNDKPSLKGADHWAFQPRRVGAPPVDVASDWSRSAIDRFLAWQTLGWS